MALLEWFLSDGLFEGLKEGFHSWKKERIYAKTHVSKTRLNFIIQCIRLGGTIVFACLKMQEILLFTSLFKSILKEFGALLMQVFITHRWQRSECIYLWKCDLVELQRVRWGCVTSWPRWSWRVNRKPISSIEERFRPQTGEMDGKIIKDHIAQSDNMVTQESAGNHQPQFKTSFHNGSDDVMEENKVLIIPCACLLLRSWNSIIISSILHSSLLNTNLWAHCVQYVCVRGMYNILVWGSPYPYDLSLSALQMGGHFHSSFHLLLCIWNEFVSWLAENKNILYSDNSTLAAIPAWPSTRAMLTSGRRKCFS